MSTSRSTPNRRPVIRASLDLDDRTLRLSGDKPFGGQTVRCDSTAMAVMLTSLINRGKLLPL